MTLQVFENQHEAPGAGEYGYAVFPSKFRPPAITPQHIVRSRLLTKLHACLDKDLTLLCAPIGFGKSVLLAQWYRELRRQNTRVVWLKLDDGDQEPMRCLIHIDSAFMLDDEVMDVSKGSKAGRGNHESRETILRRLYNTINDVKRSCVLILDAYEQAASVEFNQAVYQLLELMPENFHVAVASRVAPVQLTARLWSENRINHIPASEMCFTKEEITGLFGEETNASFTGHVMKKTQGWPIAVRLFNNAPPPGDDLLMKDQLPRESMLQIKEFIWDQLLKSLPDITRRTLIKTSFLEEIIPELSDRICLHDKSSALLEDLSHLSPLIANKAETGDVYVVNPLLRECLQLSLHSLPKTELNRIHATVVDWYMEQRDIVTALHYVKLTDSPALFARIVEYFGPHAITIQNGVTSLKLAMEKIPANAVEKSTRLTISHAVILIKDGHFSMAQRKLEKAKKMLDWNREYEDKYHGSVQADYIASQYLLALYKNDNFNREYLDQCEIITYQNSAFDGLIGFVHALKSLLYQRNASFSRSESEADRSLRYYKTSKSNYGIASVYLLRGLCCFAKGQVDLARRFYENALNIIATEFKDDPGLNAIAVSLIAEVKYERNEIDNLAPQLDSAIEALESYDGWLDAFVVAYRTASALALMHCDAESAHVILDRAVLLGDERSLDEIKRLAHLQRINVAVRAGDLDAADDLYRQYSDENGPLETIRDKQVMWRESDDYYFTTARLLIAQGNGQEALTALESMVQEAHKTGRLLSMTHGHVLQALACQSLDKQDEAIAVLRHAATVGCSEKYLRVFIDEGEGVIPILQHVIDSERRGNTRTKLGKYCSRVLSVYRKELEGRQATTSFTPRERQVLIGLSHGNSNKIIARSLNVTESAIKFHLKKIYAKLGVSKRGTAVIEARRQQLLS